MSQYAKSALRSAKNYTKGYSDVQAKVREATSNDPWGPTGAQMNELAQMTYNQQNFVEIMEMLDKRLNDKGKNWRHVFKALSLTDYCLHAGSENVVLYFKENLYVIKTLREFQYIDDEGRDQGANVRQRAKDITNLLNDDARLRDERNGRSNMRDRMTGQDRLHRRSSRDSLDDRPSRPRITRGDTDDMERAMAASRDSAADEESRRRKQGKMDDDLAKAIALSRAEDERKKKELEDANARALFDDAQQLWGYNAYDQPVDWNANRIAPMMTGMDPYQQQQQQAWLDQQRLAEQQRLPQEEAARQEYERMMAQQQWQQQQQQQQQAQLLLTQGTGFRSNNPFAPSTSTPPVPSPAPSPAPVVEPPRPVPARNTKTDNKYAHLASLIGNRPDGVDTFGNTGDMRVPVGSGYHVGSFLKHKLIRLQIGLLIKRQVSQTRDHSIEPRWPYGRAKFGNDHAVTHETQRYKLFPLSQFNPDIWNEHHSHPSTIRNMTGKSSKGKGRDSSPEFADFMLDEEYEALEAAKRQSATQQNQPPSPVAQTSSVLSVAGVSLYPSMPLFNRPPYRTQHQASSPRIDLASVRLSASASQHGSPYRLTKSSPSLRGPLSNAVEDSVTHNHPHPSTQGNTSYRVSRIGSTSVAHGFPALSMRAPGQSPRRRAKTAPEVSASKYYPNLGSSSTSAFVHQTGYVDREKAQAQLQSKLLQSSRLPQVASARPSPSQVNVDTIGSGSNSVGTQFSGSRSFNSPNMSSFGSAKNLMPRFSPKELTMAERHVEAKSVVRSMKNHNPNMVGPNKDQGTLLVPRQLLDHKYVSPQQPASREPSAHGPMVNRPGSMAASLQHSPHLEAFIGSPRPLSSSHGSNGHHAITHASSHGSKSNLTKAIEGDHSPSEEDDHQANERGRTNHVSASHMLSYRPQAHPHHQEEPHVTGWLPHGAKGPKLVIDTNVAKQPALKSAVAPSIVTSPSGKSS